MLGEGHQRHAEKKKDNKLGQVHHGATNVSMIGVKPVSTCERDYNGSVAGLNCELLSRKQKDTDPDKNYNVFYLHYYPL